MTTAMDLRRGGERFTTRTSWLDSRHSFSFGPHYDPVNTHFGLLLVSNDDVVAPGTGFETHPHRDMEIVTWVLDGALVHQDSRGHNGVIYPGLAQRMSAGAGISHSEKNDSWRLTGAAAGDAPVHFVQMWVAPDESGIEPGYEQLDIGPELAGGGLVVVASGRREHADARAIRIHQRDAALLVARIGAGDSVELPTAAYVHLYVAKGSVVLEGAGVLAAGDSARVTAAHGQRVTAAGGRGSEVLGSEVLGAEVLAAEVLVWEMHSAAG
jgi:quercetin 2,3-dioxygenase